MQCTESLQGEFIAWVHEGAWNEMDFSLGGKKPKTTKEIQRKLSEDFYCHRMNVVCAKYERFCIFNNKVRLFALLLISLCAQAELKQIKSVEQKNETRRIPNSINVLDIYGGRYCCASRISYLSFTSPARELASTFVTSSFDRVTVQALLDACGAWRFRAGNYWQNWINKYDHSSEAKHRTHWLQCGPSDVDENDKPKFRIFRWFWFCCGLTRFYGCRKIGNTAERPNKSEIHVKQNKDEIRGACVERCRWHLLNPASDWMRQEKLSWENLARNEFGEEKKV